MIGRDSLKGVFRDSLKGGRFSSGRTLLFWLATGFLGMVMAGCASIQTNDLGANQSLVEIGEDSLERGEALESDNRRREANAAYRRALWAFRYHEKLTGEQPLLTDEALDAVKRTGDGR